MQGEQDLGEGATRRPARPPRWPRSSIARRAPNQERGCRRTGPPSSTTPTSWPVSLTTGVCRMPRSSSSNRTSPPSVGQHRRAHHALDGSARTGRRHDDARAQILIGEDPEAAAGQIHDRGVCTDFGHPPGGSPIEAVGSQRTSGSGSAWRRPGVPARARRRRARGCGHDRAVASRPSPESNSSVSSLARASNPGGPEHQPLAEGVPGGQRSRHPSS